MSIKALVTEKSPKIKAVEFIDWPIANVSALTTTRLPFNKKTSNNQPPYDAFNLGLHVGDLESCVIEHRKQLLSSLPEGSQIQWLEQVHGSHVHYAKDYQSTPVQADAVYTNNKQLALAIMTADCLPILLSSKNGKEIAAIHAGWRPLADNIIVKTLEKFEAKPCDIVAWLGPCISQQAFEVGSEVKNRFIQLTQDNNKAFKKNIERDGYYFADLPLIAKQQLQALGVTSIIDDCLCTYANPDLFYSYRRDGITGRMASLIAIK